MAYPMGTGGGRRQNRKLFAVTHVLLVRGQPYIDGDDTAAQMHRRL